VARHGGEIVQFAEEAASSDAEVIVAARAAMGQSMGLPMVASMRKVLPESGVNDDNIRTEEFTGY
jgi:hypothetical protein